jgi:putative chitinase
VLTSQALKQICPNANPAIISAIVDHAGDVFAKRGIQGDTEICQLIAQICAETWGLTLLEEDLHYSASRLWKVFGHAHFKSEIDAAHVAAQGPQAIADRVYGGRMGNTRVGDGWAFRGRGLLCLTGRDEYAAIERATGLPLTAKPELVSSPDHALDIACAYWTSRNIHAPARAGNTAEVTRLINGGLNGLPERVMYLGRANHFIPQQRAGAAPVKLMSDILDDDGGNLPAPVATAIAAPAAPSLLARLQAGPLPPSLLSTATPSLDDGLIQRATRSLIAAGHSVEEAWSAVVSLLCATKQSGA